MSKDDVSTFWFLVSQGKLLLSYTSRMLKEIAALLSQQQQEWKKKKKKKLCVVVVCVC